MEPLSEAATLPNLWSPECLARGLPQGGKPTTKSVLRRTVRRSQGRKSERISESKLCGAVNCTPVALLIRGSLRARGWWDLLIGSSTVTKIPPVFRAGSVLAAYGTIGTGTCRPSLGSGYSAAEVPTGPTVQGGQTGV